MMIVYLSALEFKTLKQFKREKKGRRTEKRMIEKKIVEIVYFSNVGVFRDHENAAELH